MKDKSFVPEATFVSTGMRGMYYGAQGFSEIGNFIGTWLGRVLLFSFAGKTMFLTLETFVNGIIC